MISFRQEQPVQWEEKDDAPTYESTIFGIHEYSTHEQVDETSLSSNASDSRTDHDLRLYEHAQGIIHTQQLDRPIIRAYNIHTTLSTHYITTTTQ